MVNTSVILTKVCGSLNLYVLFWIEKGLAFSNFQGKLRREDLVENCNRKQGVEKGDVSHLGAVFPVNDMFGKNNNSLVRIIRSI